MISMIFRYRGRPRPVSILIVMDVLQWFLPKDSEEWSFLAGLNPYCNGCTSMMKNLLRRRLCMSSLNPYCNGCTSMIRSGELEKFVVKRVSILIVMDVLQWWLCSRPAPRPSRSLNPYCNGCTSMILPGIWGMGPPRGSLNPYCNGCTSMI